MNYLCYWYDKHLFRDLKSKPHISSFYCKRLKAAQLALHYLDLLMPMGQTVFIQKINFGMLHLVSCGELHQVPWQHCLGKAKSFSQKYLFSYPHMENCNSGTLLFCARVQIHTHGSRLREPMRCGLIAIMTGLDRASFPSDTWRGLCGDLGARLSCQQESLNSNWRHLDGPSVSKKGLSGRECCFWMKSSSSASSSRFHAQRLTFMCALLFMTSLSPSENGVCCPGRCAYCSPH